MYIYEPYQLITYITVGVLTFIFTFAMTYLFAVPKELLTSDTE